jgi:hypothetical protein
MAEIIGKIVRILSEHEVVINKGLVDGVKYNMEFVIYEEGDPIVDPHTREVLDRIEIVKDRVYVTHLQSRICITSTGPVAIDLGQAIASAQKRGEHSIALSPPSTPRTIHPNLHVAEGQIRPLRESSLEIHIGDKVRNVER